MNLLCSVLACAARRALGLLAVLGSLLAWAVVAHAGGDDARSLRQLRDPFERPAAPAPVKGAPPTSAALPAAADMPAVPPWLPELRAVVYEPGRGKSLVNISGAVLAVGESVRGYRVVKINERSVVVARDGARLTLTLDNREASQ